MANGTNEEKGHGKGFFATAIATPGHLKRALILTGILACILLLALSFVAWEIRPYILPNIEGFSFSADEKGHAIKITLGRKSMSVVNVPAYQFWTRTGVTLGKKNSIKIRASGLVSTSASPPELNDKKDKLTDIEKRIIAIESDRDIHSGWRDADGQPTHVIKPANGIEPVKECNGGMASKSDKLRLDAKPGAEYGTLLGFIIPKESKSSGKKIDTLLGTKSELREVPILRLGSYSEIKYEKTTTTNTFIVTSSASPGKPQSIPANYEDGELYLTINDTVVNDVEDMTYPCKVKPDLDKNRKRQIKLYEMMHYSKDIWYLDNRGSFLVTMEKGPVDETK